MQSMARRERAGNRQCPQPLEALSDRAGYGQGRLAKGGRSAGFPGLTVAFLVVFALLAWADSALAAGDLGSSGGAEAEAEVVWLSDDDEAGVLLQEKTLGCNGSGKYCSGLFEDLVYRIRFSGDGKISIWLQPGAIQAIESNLYCTLSGTVYVLIPAGHAQAERWLQRLDLARALGEVFRLDWAQGPSGFCELQRIFHPY